MVKRLPIILAFLFIFLVSIVSVSAFPSVTWSYYDRTRNISTLSTLWETDWSWTLDGTNFKTTNAENNGGYIRTKTNTSNIMSGFQFKTYWYDADVPPYTYICIGDGDVISSSYPTNGICFRWEKYHYFSYVGFGSPTLIEYDNGSATTIDSTISGDQLDNDQEFKIYIDGTTLYATVDKNVGGASFDESWTISYENNVNTYALISTSDGNNEDENTLVDTWIIFKLQSPSVNAYSAFDIEITTATLGATFLFNDYDNISAYWVIDDVNQTEINYTYNTSSSQYTTLDLTNLSDETNYVFKLCLEYEDGTFCTSEKNFTTDAYEDPTINIFGVSNITNHEAILATTILFNNYDELDVYWKLDGDIVDAIEMNQNLSDEFDTSRYYTFNLEDLDYETFYEYEVCVDFDSYDYINGTVTTCDDPLVIDYDCDGALVTLWDGSNVNATRCLEMSENFESWIYFQSAYDENFPDGLNATCVEVDNGYCAVSNGTKYNSGDSNSFASNCITVPAEVPEALTVCSGVKNFTTLDAYIPTISIFNAFNITGTSAILGGSFDYQDYNSTIPYFTLNGTDLYPKYNFTEGVSGNYQTYDLSGLFMNTSYDYNFCIGYGTGWALYVCDTEKSFTTGFQPIITLLQETNVKDTSASLKFNIDYNGATNVSYSMFGNSSYIIAIDGVNTYNWTGLLERTNYTYHINVEFDTLGNTLYIDSDNRTFITYYENAFDDVWDNMLQGSSIAKIILGFTILLGIIFFIIAAFGHYNLQVGMLGILIITIIAAVIVSLMKLFPLYILLLLIVGSVLLVILKNMFFGGGENR